MFPRGLLTTRTHKPRRNPDFPGTVHAPLSMIVLFQELDDEAKLKTDSYRARWFVPF